MNELAFDLESRHPARPAADFTLTVYGHAEPAGSKRMVEWKAKDGRSGTNLIDANPKAGNWKKEIAQAAGKAMEGKLMFDGPTEVTFIFYRQRPQGHFGTKGIRPSAPRYPTSKPDLLKLARGAEDALTGIVYRDDAAIVIEHLEKRFGTPERVEIEIRRLG